VDSRGRLLVALTAAVVALLVLATMLLGGRDDGAAPATTAAPATAPPLRTAAATGAPLPSPATTATRAIAPAPTTAAAATSTTTPVTTAAGLSVDTPGSLWWLVNRDRPLPDGYVPPDLVVPDVPLRPDRDTIELRADVARAFEAMAADATAAGYRLQLNGGYRSLQHQQELYDLYRSQYGDAAADLVAQPGTSEHQTGLAADVGLVDLPGDQTFGQTPASTWVAANAHRFGFIVRYPPDKAAITGYRNEPWHLRYVGVDLATQLHASGLTMEEHFGLVPAG